MNTTFTLIGSYKWVFIKTFELKMCCKPSETKEPKIINHKSVTNSSVLLNAIYLLWNIMFNQ